MDDINNFPRAVDWQTMLDDYVLAAERQPFSWEGRNCAMFAAGWVQLATGRAMDLPVTAAGRDVARYLRTSGGLQAQANRRLGEALPGAFARCGDVVLLGLPRSRGRTMQAFGVCTGAVAAAQGQSGLVMVPITQAEAAWRV